MENLARRAIVAYIRSEGAVPATRVETPAEPFDSPSVVATRVAATPVEHKGRTYVVLTVPSRTEDRIVAVYRLKTTGMLRRLKRWPAALSDMPIPGRSVASNGRSDGGGI